MAVIVNRTPRQLLVGLVQGAGWLAIPFLVIWYVSSGAPLSLELYVNQLLSTAVALGLTIAAINWLHISVWWGAHLQWLRMPGRIHVAWVGVALVLGIQTILGLYLPPARAPGFEELQTGSIAYYMLQGHPLPTEFRFTNLLAVTGFLAGDFSLESLRLPFRIVALLNCVLVVLTLRRLGVGWLPTVLAILVMASLRVMVISSGSADELFSGAFFMLLLITCVAYFETSTNQRLFWAGAAGIVAGILLFEYVSYKGSILLALGWVLFRSLTFDRILLRDRFAPLLFLITASTMGASTLIQTALYPNESVLLDGFRRHGAERPPLDLYLQQLLINLDAYSRALLGFPSDANGLLFVLGSEPLFSPVFGLLFGISLVLGLFVPVRPLARGFAMTVLALVAVVSISANNLNIGRLVPAIVLLILLYGMGLQRAFDLIKAATQREPAPGTYGAAMSLAPASGRRHTGSWIGRGLIALVGCVLAGLTLAINGQAVVAFANSPAMIYEFENNEYPVCAAVGELGQPERPIFLLSYDAPDMCQRLDPVWLTAPQGLTIQSIDRLPTPDELQPGTLVLAGRSHGLQSEELALMLDLARQSDNLTSLRAKENVLGQIAVVGFCVQCE